MRSGELRERITLKSTTRTVDARWGVSSGTTTEAVLWARVEPVKADEQFNGQQVQSDATHKVTIRHRAGVSERDVIAWKGRTLEIVAVVSDEHRREMTITCREQSEVANG